MGPPCQATLPLRRAPCPAMPSVEQVEPTGDGGPPCQVAHNPSAAPSPDAIGEQVEPIDDGDRLAKSGFRQPGNGPCKEDCHPERSEGSYVAGALRMILRRASSG